MLVLAIDTSGRQGSVALARGDDRAFELLESVPIQGGTFSAELVPQIADLLARHNLKKQELDGFAAASRPGSFTGLRVGLAAIKALAEILNKPIAVVSVLQAIAAHDENGRGAVVLAALDAGRGEIYAGEYKRSTPLPVIIEESVVQPQELAKLIEQRAGELELATPDASVLEQLKKSLAKPEQLSARVIAHPGSAGIARLGITKILAGEILSVDQLDANYVRRSDAEIFSLPKLMGGR